MITRHAQLRARQRCGASYGDCQTFLEGLWMLGRPATPRDFGEFLLNEQRDRSYRVAIRGGVSYMVVMGTNGNFITVVKKR
jgi:hypothetical protein